jgi:hypothetical protein
MGNREPQPVCVTQAGRFPVAFRNEPSVAGTGGTLTFTDPTATGTQRFYRIRRW